MFNKLTSEIHEKRKRFCKTVQLTVQLIVQQTGQLTVQQTVQLCDSKTCEY